ncbi:hypothetical protein M427DRAFT_50136 [Gonapodya prolifera JEL478]|uniref:Uncharacterized protein n=1 Tax=Gonapodya prolifera (strain JEL478) TaxID=1344416 RepID=A0A138ZWY7_GONPJ|nr:hypothetical protein M427DRAFT_50136 [Gonapodya prolifera JEL478]|eukprot:KXS08971.1 hypothetical protein M427DRAFT_50136 [Gonapodya prolifera JEL478]
MSTQFSATGEATTSRRGSERYCVLVKLKDTDVMAAKYKSQKAFGDAIKKGNDAVSNLFGKNSVYILTDIYSVHRISPGEFGSIVVDPTANEAFIKYRDALPEGKKRNRASKDGTKFISVYDIEDKDNEVCILSEEGSAFRTNYVPGDIANFNRELSGSSIDLMKRYSIRSREQKDAVEVEKHRERAETFKRLFMLTGNSTDKLYLVGVWDLVTSNFAQFFSGIEHMRKVAGIAKRQDITNKRFQLAPHSDYPYTSTSKILQVSARFIIIGNPFPPAVWQEDADGSVMFTQHLRSFLGLPTVEHIEIAPDINIIGDETVSEDETVTGDEAINHQQHIPRLSTVAPPLTMYRVPPDLVNALSSSEVNTVLEQHGWPRSFGVVDDGVHSHATEAVIRAAASAVGLDAERIFSKAVITPVDVEQKPYWKYYMHGQIRLKRLFDDRGIVDNVISPSDGRVLARSCTTCDIMKDIKKFPEGRSMCRPCKQSAERVRLRGKDPKECSWCGGAHYSPGTKCEQCRARRKLTNLGHITPDMAAEDPKRHPEKCIHEFCGKPFTTTDFAFRNDLRVYRQECKECVSERARMECYSQKSRDRIEEKDLDGYLMRNAARLAALRERDPERFEAYRDVYNQKTSSKLVAIRGGARERGIHFEESEAELMMSKLELPCVYCMFVDPRGFPIGLDRVDSELAYTDANTVPCCKGCNLMKSNLMPHDFQRHVERMCTWLGLEPWDDLPSERSYNTTGLFLNGKTPQAAGRKVDLITHEQREELKRGMCFGCGATPAGGVDREENDEGYTESNARPACFPCNRMKSDRTDEALKHHLKCLLWVIRNPEECSTMLVVRKKTLVTVDEGSIVVADEESEEKNARDVARKKHFADRAQKKKRSEEDMMEDDGFETTPFNLVGKRLRAMELDGTDDNQPSAKRNSRNSWFAHKTDGPVIVYKTRPILQPVAKYWNGMSEVSSALSFDESWLGGKYGKARGNISDWNDDNGVALENDDDEYVAKRHVIPPGTPKNSPLWTDLPNNEGSAYNAFIEKCKKSDTSHERGTNDRFTAIRITDNVTVCTKVRASQLELFTGLKKSHVSKLFKGENECVRNGFRIIKT